MRRLHIFACLVLIIITVLDFVAATNLNQLVDTIILKTIQSKDGDTIDCVNITRQPALSDLRLQGHAIKLKPSCYPGGPSNNNKVVESNEITQVWQYSGECPIGTVPMRRIEKPKGKGAVMLTKKPRDVSPSSSSKPASNAAVAPSIHEYAFTYTGRGNYFGARATISSWNPYVERNNEFSLSQLWIVAGSGPNLNTIEAGWHVYPALTGDRRTRLFVYWTRDNYGRTGCYNLRCSGFVQITNRMVIGGSMATTANRSRPEATLLVWKDAKQRVWWLKYNNIVVGYWPDTIFTALRGGASLVEWGGEIINLKVNRRHTSTQMGSGRFPAAGFGGASYFRNLEVVNNRNTLVPPPAISGLATNPRCYGVTVGKSRNWGNYFYYGGPGRNRLCQ